MGECLIIRSGGGTDTSDATATADVILSGYTAYVNDELITGAMPVQSLNQTLSPGGSVTLPAGYYEEGENVISVSTLAEETAANAASSHILSGYSGWINGVLVNGSMANIGNVNQSLAANGSYTIPAGWHAGSGKVTQSLAVHWGGTYTPNTGNQVMCWAGWYTGGNIIVAGASTLTAGNIRNGITIFGIRGTFQGWVDSSMTAYVISSSSPVHDDWYSNTSGDSWTNNWCRARYSQDQKTIQGWNNVTVTMTGYSNTDWAKNKWEVAAYLRLSPGVPWIGNTGYTNIYGHDMLDGSGKIYQKFIGWFGSISRNNFVTQKTVSLANAATTTAYGCCVSSVCRSRPEWTPEVGWTFTYTFSK